MPKRSSELVEPLPRVLVRGCASVADKTGAYLLLSFTYPDSRFDKKRFLLDFRLYVAWIGRYCSNKAKWFVGFSRVIKHYNVAFIDDNISTSLFIPATAIFLRLRIALNSTGRSSKNLSNPQNPTGSFMIKAAIMYTCAKSVVLRFSKCVIEGSRCECYFRTRPIGKDTVIAFFIKDISIHIHLAIRSNQFVF